MIILKAKQTEENTKQLQYFIDERERSYHGEEQEAAEGLEGEKHQSERY